MARLDFSRLNEQQYKVATSSKKGFKLILAGAGTGKTTTIAHRVAYLIEHKHISPKNILLLTFTNKAATEIKERVDRILGKSITEITSGTFHYFGNILLRKYAHLIGYKNSYSILDPHECIDALRVISPKSYKEADLKSAYYTFKHSELCHIPLKKLVKDEKKRKVLKRLYADYGAYKQKSQYVDFEDLLFLPIKILQDSQEASKAVTSKYQYVLVDEYQDTCKTQALFLQELVKVSNTIMAVGDPAQSIYMFRGARYKNIVEFSKDFPKTQVFLLEDNYRSTNQILALANRVSERIDTKHKKKLRSQAKLRDGKKPTLISYYDKDIHAWDTANKIGHLLEEGHKPNELAVIYRSNYTASLLELKLRSNGIPYIKYGGLSFFDRVHVKEFISVVTSFYNKANELSWVKILSFCEGIGPVNARKIYGEFLKFSDFDKFQSKYYYQDLKQIQASRETFKKSKGASISERLNICLNMYKMVLASKFGKDKTDYASRLNDLRAFISSTSKAHYKSIGSMLKLLKLDRKTEDADKDKKIILTTVHSAKGLEFETVFIHGVSCNNFPGFKADKNNEEEMDEERRVLYVAITRAKSSLIMTLCPAKDQNDIDLYDETLSNEEDLPPDISPFLEEIKDIKSLVDIEFHQPANFNFS